jgi:hypothetical protein
MLDRAAAQCHRARGAAQAVAYFIHQMLIFPTGDTGFRARGAARLNRAMPAFVGPISSNTETVFLARVAVDQLIFCWADVDVPHGVIFEVGLHIHDRFEFTAVDRHAITFQCADPAPVARLATLSRHCDPPHASTGGWTGAD